MTETGGTATADMSQSPAPDEPAPDESAPDGPAHRAVREPRGGEGGALDREGDVAADYLEELLDIADLDGDIDIDVDGDRALVSLVGGDLGHLVGTDGSVLMALQDLTRLAVIRETGERSRIVVDVDGYRDRRRVEIVQLVATAARQVGDGAPRAELPTMSAFERKIAHDAVAGLGLRSDSEGEDPHRHVVVHPS